MADVTDSVLPSGEQLSSPVRPSVSSRTPKGLSIKPGVKPGVPGNRRTDPAAEPAAGSSPTTENRAQSKPSVSAVAGTPSAAAQIASKQPQPQPEVSSTPTNAPKPVPGQKPERFTNLNKFGKPSGRQNPSAAIPLFRDLPSVPAAETPPGAPGSQLFEYDGGPPENHAQTDKAPLPPARGQPGAPTAPDPDRSGTKLDQPQQKPEVSDPQPGISPPRQPGGELGSTQLPTGEIDSTYVQLQADAPGLQQQIPEDQHQESPQAAGLELQTQPEDVEPVSENSQPEQKQQAVLEHPLPSPPPLTEPIAVEPQLQPSSELQPKPQPQLLEQQLGSQSQLRPQAEPPLLAASELLPQSGLQVQQPQLQPDLGSPQPEAQQVGGQPPLLGLNSRGQVENADSDTPEIGGLSPRQQQQEEVECRPPPRTQGDDLGSPQEQQVETQEQQEEKDHQQEEEQKQQKVDLEPELESQAAPQLPSPSQGAQFVWDSQSPPYPGEPGGESPGHLGGVPSQQLGKEEEEGE
ncbi:hypothetical protein Vretimale_19213, partial [Volvox reticuliferus]